MSDDHHNDRVDDEITFWRDFIKGWEARHGRPATPRMQQALAHAEAKRNAGDRRCLEYPRKPATRH